MPACIKTSRKKHLYHFIQKDIWIVENFRARLWKMDELIKSEKSLKLSKQEIGSIICRFAITITNLAHSQIICPYLLTIDKYISLLTHLEKEFDIALPQSLKTDFLFFQTATLTTTRKIELLTQSLANSATLIGTIERSAKDLLESLQPKSDKQQFPQEFESLANNYPTHFMLWLQFALITRIEFPSNEKLDEKFIQKFEVIFFIFNIITTHCQGRFPFKDALIIFKTFPSKTPNLAFLHTSLFFFHCKKKLQINDHSQLALLFNALHQLTPEERIFYEDHIQDPQKWIQQKFQQEPLPWPTFIEYVKKEKISLNFIAHVILRFAITTTQSSSTLAPHTSGSIFTDQVLLFEIIEKNMGILPPFIKIDILFFQTAPESLEIYLPNIYLLYQGIRDKGIENCKIIALTYEQIAKELIRTFKKQPQLQSLDPDLSLRAKNSYFELIIWLQMMLGHCIELPKPLNFSWLQEHVFAKQKSLFFILNVLTQECDPFPFEQGYKVLETFYPLLIPQNYHFIRTALLFFYCKSKFAIPETHAPMLFEAFYQLTTKEQQEYCQLILDPKLWNQEHFPRTAFQVTDQVITYFNLKQISLQNIVPIILKFLTTKSDTHPPSLNLPSYLSLEFHTELLNDIDKQLNLNLPLSIVIDFLTFLTTNAKTKENIIHFFNLQKKIKENYLETLTLPPLLYQSFKKMAANFIDSIQIDLKGKFSSKISSQLVNYPKSILLFAKLLQFSTYPMPFCRFQNAMPEEIQITKGEYIINKEKFCPVNHIAPIYSDFAQGPAKFCYLLLQTSTQPLFCVSLINSLENPKQASFFQIPIDISFLSDAKATTFYNLLYCFIDSFAEEVLPIEKEKESSKENRKIPHFPDESSLQNKPIEQIFDQFLDCSPFLAIAWVKIHKQFGDQLPLVKRALYTFIKTLRSSFKKSFFSLHHNSASPSPLHFFSLDEEAQKEEKSSFQSLFAGNFKQIYQSTSKMTQINKNLCFYESKENYQMNFNFVFPPTNNASSSTPSLLGIQLSLFDNQSQKEESLTVYYDAFKNEQHFVRLMIWQIYLLKQQLNANKKSPTNKIKTNNQTS